MKLVETSSASIAAAGKRLRDGSLTAVELVQSYLERVRAVDPVIHAFITVTEELAIQQAGQRDKELRDGVDRGPMHGIPIVHKDIFDTAGVRTTIGSRLFAERIPREDAGAVRALNDAGAVSIGKTSMPEFASDPTGTNRAFGDLRNPWQLECSAGGSSGGTAAAVAAGLCLGGTGSDTGGSIRIPASWCGVVGLRPSLGLVSVDGAYPRAPSLDAAGPLAATTRDCALIFAAMQGPGHDYSVEFQKSCSGLRLGVLADLPDTDPEIIDSISRAVKQFTELGVDSVPIHNAFLAGADADCERVLDLLLYEFNEVFGAFYRKTANRDEAFGPVLHANIARGSAVTADDYKQTLSLRPKLLSEIQTLFDTVDAIVTPTTPTVAAPFKGDDKPFASSRQFTLPVSFLGLPALSTPCGWNSQGLPIGLQLIANAQREGLLFRLGTAYEATA